MYGLGAVTLPQITSCPPCSYLLEGTCVVCGPADPHPACEHCLAGQYRPPGDPWYTNEILVAVTTSVIIAAASIWITRRMEMASAKKARRKR